MGLSVLSLCYIISVVTFIVGLQRMSHPATARQGNLIAGAGMVLAIIATLFLYRDDTDRLLGNHLWIFAGLLVGTVIGVLAAKKVKMTAEEEDLGKGNLFATGLVAGGAIAGVIVAALSSIDSVSASLGKVNAEHGITAALGEQGYKWLGVIAFAIMAFVLYRIGKKPQNV